MASNCRDRVESYEMAINLPAAGQEVLTSLRVAEDCFFKDTFNSLFKNLLLDKLYCRLYYHPSILQIQIFTAIDRSTRFHFDKVASHALCSIRSRDPT